MQVPLELNFKLEVPHTACTRFRHHLLVLHAHHLCNAQTSCHLMHGTHVMLTPLSKYTINCQTRQCVACMCNMDTPVRETTNATASRPHQLHEPHEGRQVLLPHDAANLFRWWLHDGVQFQRQLKAVPVPVYPVLHHAAQIRSQAARSSR